MLFAEASGRDCRLSEADIDEPPLQNRIYEYTRYRSRCCRTVTIERDDGSIRTIRRCD